MGASVGVLVKGVLHFEADINREVDACEYHNISFSPLFDTLSASLVALST